MQIITYNIETMKFFKSIFFIFSFCCICKVHGNETVKISFSQDQFVYYKNSEGKIEIVSAKNTSVFDSDTLQPALPWIPINVSLQKKTAFSGFKTELIKKEILSNVVLASNPPNFTTNETRQIQEESSHVDFNKQIYPQNNIRYIYSSSVGDETIARFQVCPFIYDNKEKKLYLIENLFLDISTENNISEETPLYLSNKQNMQDVFQIQTINKKEQNHRMFLKSSNTSLDYIIITKDNLCSAFNDIAKWKRTKGLKTKIISIEDIEKEYYGQTLTEKIKKCIYNYYNNYGIQYVLLGGDDTIVPVCYCYCPMFSKNEDYRNYIPSDAYYSCFGNNFNWDENNNGQYGEVADKIDFTPSVFLTRLPIRTVNDVNSYTQKLLDYEQNPNIAGYKSQMISMGYKLFDKKPNDKYYDGHSDSELKSDFLYETYIKPYSNIKHYKFFDTGNNLPEGDSYIFDTANIQEQMEKGFSYIDFTAHGSPFAWGTGEENFYTTEQANILNNSGLGIITTGACLTNAFDTPDSEMYSVDPCLSESLIRNANSGIIAYWGCSREGWDSRSISLGTSTNYIASFYKYLFSDDIKNKTLSAISTAAKNNYINASNGVSSYRWIQLGLNTVGDPELPLYTEQPKIFNSAKIKYTGYGNIEIETGIDGTTICVSSDNDENYYKVFRDTCRAECTNIPERSTVCITRYGYIPKVIKIEGKYIQNENITEQMILKKQFINVGSHVTGSKPDGYVNFEATNIFLQGKSVTLTPEIHINRNCDLKIINY